MNGRPESDSPPGRAPSGMLLRLRETAKTIITPPPQQPGRLSLPRLMVHPRGGSRR